MTFRNKYLLAIAGLVLFALVLVAPERNAAQIPPTTQLISASSLLAGLGSGALFPFIDTTPHSIVQAHIADIVMESLLMRPLLVQPAPAPHPISKCLLEWQEEPWSM